ncbi:MAG: glutathionylspermidine synthase family protein [Rhodospirillales bacterium]|nr:glutathionylspermidine synthase family protein [Rhodospirillales bacterium]
MERVATDVRADLAGRVADLGLSAAHEDGAAYLVSDAAYAFDKAEIDVLHDAGAELERMCLELVDRVVNDDLLDRFDLSPLAARLVADSWDSQARNLIGRFDLAWQPGKPPKLLEYNAETPVGLVEAACFQADWRAAAVPDALQFNEIEGRLAQAWRDFGLAEPSVHFAGSPGDAEASLTLDFLAATARAGGLEAVRLDLDAIGWDGGKFLDADDRPIRTLFKLYPWAWLVEDEFGPNIESSGLAMIEPAWKMLLADKRMLALLWEMHPGHPNLLPASLQARDIAGPAVAKPALGRDGAGVKLFAKGLSAPATAGDAADPLPQDGPLVYQAMAELARTGPVSALASVWMVASQPAGLSMREADGDFIGSDARFVPHFVR